MPETKDSTRRLHHAVPPWVPDGSVFHIRIRAAPGNPRPLTEPATAKALIESAVFYHQRGTWFCRLLVLMPDHLHALLAFPPAERMNVVIGRWKAWQHRARGVCWQDGFFDHRIRDDHELQLKADYIRRNPVAKGLCPSPEAWPWVLDRATLESEH